MKPRADVKSDEILSSAHSSSCQSSQSETFQVARNSGPATYSSPSNKNFAKGDKSWDTVDMLSENISFKPKEVDLEQLEKQIKDKIRLVIFYSPL